MAFENTDGLIYEPRSYQSVFLFVPTVFDPITGAGSVVTQQRNEPGAYRNGEQFPVRITHLTAYMGGGGEVENFTSPPVEAGVTGGEERALVYYGLRVMDHDTYYPSSVFTPIPLLQNVNTSVNSVASAGTITYKLDKPFLMSNQDALEVKISLQSISGDEAFLLLTVAASGYGLWSKQPVRMGASVPVTASAVGATLSFNTDSFRNYSTEPFAITELTFTPVGSPVVDPLSSLNTIWAQDLLVQVRGIGNNTTSRWFTFSNQQIPFPGGGGARIPMMPVGLLGTKAGRCVTHKLPTTAAGDGWVLEPGEEVFIEVTPQYDQSILLRTEFLYVALHGYITAR